INFFDPGRSMILTKPTTALPHKGGKRFDINSPEYKVLSEWIASGAPGPKNEDARIQSIEMLPPQELLQPGDNQQLIVQAHFTDEMVLTKLRELNIPPSPRCTDADFIRRAFLDTAGILPSADETRQFLADKSSGKRDALIERLLQRPEFVDYWSHKWSDLLLV